MARGARGAPARAGVGRHRAAALLHAGGDLPARRQAPLQVPPPRGVVQGGPCCGGGHAAQPRGGAAGPRAGRRAPAALQRHRAAVGEPPAGGVQPLVPPVGVPGARGGPPCCCSGCATAGANAQASVPPTARLPLTAPPLRRTPVQLWTFLLNGALRDSGVGSRVQLRAGSSSGRDAGSREES